MAGAEHLSHAAAYDGFLSNHAAPIDQSFSPDQSRSLQGLLSAHHACLFRCVYEMETHLETSLEELKSRQSRAEKEIAKINLLVENTRCNVLAVAKKLDEAINAYSGKSDIPQEHEARGRDGDSESPGYSDSSTLRSSPNERPRKRKLSTVSPAFLHYNASVNLFNMGFEADAFHANGSTVRNFGILPSIASTITPATWHSSNGTPHLTPGSDDRSMQNSSPGPSSMPCPSISAVNPSDMDIETNNVNPEPADHDRQLDLSCEQDCSDDEEIVAMQLFLESASSSPVKPSTPSIRNIESICNDAPHPLSSPLKNHSSPCPQHVPIPSSSLLSPPLPPPRNQSRTPTPSHDQDPYQHQAQAQTPMEMEIETQTQTQILGPEFTSELEPAREFGSRPEPSLAPQGLPSDTFFRQSPLPLSFRGQTKSLSPLSELTDTSVEDEAEGSFADLRAKLPLSEVLPRKREEEEVTLVAASISAVSAAQLKLEERRRKKRISERERRRKKKLEALKAGSPAINTETRGKLRSRTARVTEAKTSAENGRNRTRSGGSAKKKGRAGKVVWPEVYQGDEDEFNRKLIECDLCSCWYHYGCAGITPGDIRLDSSEVYVCPVCATNGENKTKIKDKRTCCRPDCQNKVVPGEYFVSGIAGRKFRYSVDGSIRVLYLVKWDGYPIYEATWENADTLRDPHNLVNVFEEACKREQLPLDTPEPVLLSEADEWKAVLALTDPPGVKVPLVPVEQMILED